MLGTSGRCVRTSESEPGWMFTVIGAKVNKNCMWSGELDASGSQENVRQSYHYVWEGTEAARTASILLPCTITLLHYILYTVLPYPLFIHLLLLRCFWLQLLKILRQRNTVTKNTVIVIIIIVGLYSKSIRWLHTWFNWSAVNWIRFMGWIWHAKSRKKP